VLCLPQVFDEQPQFLDDRQKSAPAKRYDPKYRALTEANRFKLEDMAQQMQPPVPKVSQYPMHPKQRHFSSTLACDSIGHQQRFELCSLDVFNFKCVKRDGTAKRVNICVAVVLGVESARVG